jgi:hypothetical protein
MTPLLQQIGAVLKQTPRGFRCGKTLPGIAAQCGNSGRCAFAMPVPWRFGHSLVHGIRFAAHASMLCAATARSLIQIKTADV